MAQALVVELGLEPSGYRLIVNGGAFQDVPHVHGCMSRLGQHWRQVADLLVGRGAARLPDPTRAATR